MRFFGLDIKKAKVPTTKERDDSDDYIKNTRRDINRLRAEMEADRARFELERQRAEIREEREALLEMYQDADDEKPAIDADSMLLAILGRYLGGQQSLNTLPVPGNPQHTTPARKTYTDEELKGLLAEVPRDTLKIARKLPEERLKEEIRARVLVDADDDTLIRAVRLIKE